MNTNIPILPPRSIPSALGVHSNCVEGPKVAPDPSNFLFKDFMVETGFKFALADLGCCYVTGFLATP
jgi:hypothetical protein